MAEEDKEERKHQKAVEARVMKVRHLDPFTLTCHADGRFSAALETPPEELKPEAARSILHKMDTALEPLRDVVEEAEEEEG